MQPRSFAHYMLMKEIIAGVKVVLNGQGSDESWCGYGRCFIGYFLLTYFSHSLRISFHS
ncbi:MAG: asparagine synthase-related protein [Ignavibacteria bacterium]